MRTTLDSADGTTLLFILTRHALDPTHARGKIIVTA